jgi:hypothetical protein
MTSTSFSASITARLPWIAQLVPVDFHRHRRRLRRRRHLDHAELGAKVIGRQLAQMHQHRPRLGLRDDRHLRACADTVQRQNTAKGGQPFAFDAFLQHRPSQNFPC